MTGDILDLIDSTVRDYETGPDAVRYNPTGGGSRGELEGMLPVGVVFDELADFMRRFGEQMELVMVPAANALGASLSSAIPATREFEHAFMLGVMKAFRLRPQHFGVGNVGCFCHPAPFPAARDYRRRTKHRNRRRKP